MLFVCLEQVRANFRTAVTIPERSWGRFRDILSDFIDKLGKEGSGAERGEEDDAEVVQTQADEK